ncbi:hypothetical protein [Laspinema olomoucense]|uniref:Uncharacterized protein n=1 Tax=Laspinema olomoucense D3b TaxID=2953688 RepID=A0ABT2N5J2_9CYAN|nr:MULTISPECIES: hypothetical protein [unclassified Laspinema]MCT7977746.1 hypothetical protein [Laspinema sp. D3b]MCT7989844.1 hypothetical protein [Laspinema sp. D3a]MCT7997004.1 hypothetical protein [Laspinema sp. D3c]
MGWLPGQRGAIAGLWVILILYSFPDSAWERNKLEELPHSQGRDSICNNFLDLSGDWGDRLWIRAFF